LFTNNNKSIQLLLYIDNIVVGTKHQSEVDWFAKSLSKRFNTKNLEEIKKILGTRVTQDRRNWVIEIDQEEYLKSILDRFGITNKNYKGKSILAADYKQLCLAAIIDKYINITEYQQGIGSLIYTIIFTRPDITFVLDKLSQYISKLAEYHRYILKYLIKYLKSTVKQKLYYRPGREYKNIVVYSDTDWASNKSDRKSILESMTIFYSRPIL